MKNKGNVEKDALISGICFLAYSVVLFVIAFYTFYSYWSSLHSSEDYVSGWVNLFNIIVLLATIAFSIITLAILYFACIYLVLGIFILKNQQIFGIAIASFLLSAGQLLVWIIYIDPEYGMYAMNPVTAAGTVFFGILALLLSFQKFSSKKWFVRKFWLIPIILLVASVFVSPLQYIFLELTGGESYPIDDLRYMITIIRLIPLFPAYFFGCRWMKKQAEADL